MAGVGVDIASMDERRLLEGMLQFYVYDFSELEPAGSEAFELEGDGRFAPYPHLDDYWREASRTALIIRLGERPVGFALINAVSRSGATVDHNMAEFFVMRKHRRQGVAAAAVRAILATRAGRWEVAVAERNIAAKAFWPKTIAACPGVAGLISLAGDGVRWKGPILSFTVAG
jgi:predicted acetyltransferase